MRGFIWSFSAALLMFCTQPWAVFSDEPTPAPPEPAPLVEPDLPVASIEITDALGNPVVSEAAVGQMLILHSSKAVHANVEGSLTWIIEPQMQAFTADGGKTMILNTGLKPDILRIMQIVSTKGGKNTYQRMSLRIGAAPQPPPIVEPDDETPVTPPAPQPPTPQPGQLKVVIVEETAARNNLPPKQVLVFTSADIRAYALKACSKAADGKTADFRIYDKDVSVAQEPQWVQAAWKEPRQSLPWIVLSNGVTGFSGPLPQTAEETLSLLKKYGGE